MGFLLFIVFCCSSYVALFRRDSAKLRDINRGVIRKNVVYTLSTKFQLKENLRVMKAIMQLSIGQTVSAVITCFFFVLTEMLLPNYVQLSQLFFALTNLTLTISGDVFVLTLMVFLGLNHFRSIVPLSSKCTATSRVATVNDHHGAYNAYLHQLSSGWKI
ncbi:hypothetical protein V3C99_012999 [Haemonchus contortus]|uniref:G protein-coupled receptor n=1 Tax=Haemonchus contortus TaxID=6289 RepID=A0A7I4Y3H4_HAECO